MLTIQKTALRISQGTSPGTAIKEHIDAWNRNQSVDLHQDEPPDTGSVELNAYLAGLAEYEAALIECDPPAWTKEESRFLKIPFLLGGTNQRMINLMETPTALRRRLVFSGKPFAIGKTNKPTP